MAKGELPSIQKSSVRRYQAACGLLLVAFLGSAAWAMRAQRNYEAYVEQRLSEYPLIDPARNFIAQENFIVNIEPLRQRIRALSSAFEAEGRSASVYIEFLGSGANISINPETYIWPASLSKVPLAMAVMKKVERGEWTLENELVLMQGDADAKAGNTEGALHEHPIGTRFAIGTLLEKMLGPSDNTAYYILLRNTSESDLRAVIEGLGMEQLFTPEGRISAKEYSRVLRALYTASFLRREYSQQILEWLDASAFDEFIARAIPPEVPLPHKFGEHIQVNAYSDSGIVYIPERPYIISVMVQGKSEEGYTEEKEAAAQFMRAVSETAYEYFSAYDTEE